MYVHRHSKQPNAARVWERSQKEKDGRNIKKEVRGGVDQLMAQKEGKKKCGLIRAKCAKE